MSTNFDFNLSTLNSFFEIIVAFTFVFRGFQGFQNQLNKLTIRTYESKLKYHTEEILILKDKVLLLLQNDRYYEQEYNRVEVMLKDAKKVKALVISCYNGNSFCNIFYLSCAINLIFVILGAFQSIFNLRIEIFTILILTIPTIFLMIKIVLFIQNRAKDKQIHKDSMLKRPGFFYSRLPFILIGLILFVIVGIYLDYRFYKNFVIAFNESYMLYIIYRLFIIFLILIVSLIPFYVYLNRKRIFLNYHDQLLKEYISNITGELERINLHYESRINSDLFRQNN